MMFTYGTVAALPEYQKRLGTGIAGEFHFSVKIHGEYGGPCAARVKYVRDSKGNVVLECDTGVMNSMATYDVYSLMYGTRPLSEVLEEQCRMLLLAIGDK